MKPLIIQQVYPDVPEGVPYVQMADLCKDRHDRYCEKHGFDFRYVKGPTNPKYADVHKGGWDKIQLIKDALAEGRETIVWLDADAMVYDMETDLQDACVEGIGVCWHRIPQLDHWNTGVMYFRNTPEVVKFVDDWISKFPGSDRWMEQGEFNKLAMQGKIVQTISDRWNATLNYTMVPDAVVLGFHGNGTPPQRFEMMKQALAKLEAA
jgi:hypothetical protein